MREVATVKNLDVIVRADKPVGIGDAHLVASALDDQRWAKDALFRRHGRAVARTVSRLLGSTQDVEDVVHDVYIRAFERLESLKDPELFKPWIMRIAVTRTRNVLRRRRLERVLGLYRGDDDASLERLVSDDVSPEERADLSFIDDVLKRVPSNQRIAWLLRAVEGRTLPDVASLCGCSVATAKRRVRVVQKLLAARITIKGARHG